MAKTTKKNNKKIQETKPVKEPYVSVTDRWWGKLLIWLLIIGTLLFIFLAAVYSLGLNLNWWS